MTKWWRTICSWFRRAEPVVEVKVEVCDVDHVEDHICWDDLFLEPLPGDLCWFCNKCKRSWHTPNPHKFPSELAQERRDKDEHIWAEFTSYMGPFPKGVKFLKPVSLEYQRHLDKKRKERENAKSKSSRKRTGRKRKSVSDAARRTGL
ncbi:hypothetical protein LCGC14_0329640 [marine sediment metagenome]|uniref:Uncharacterized protein n=1 Tax=marine sediment metagenome TaxID=412755 RepID=A0A0F9W3Z7_9ZZZZ